MRKVVSGASCQASVAGSGSMPTMLAFTTPPPSRSTMPDTYGTETSGVARCTMVKARGRRHWPARRAAEVARTAVRACIAPVEEERAAGAALVRDQVWVAVETEVSDVGHLSSHPDPPASAESSGTDRHKASCVRADRLFFGVGRGGLGGVAGHDRLDGAARQRLPPAAIRSRRSRKYRTYRSGRERVQQDRRLVTWVGERVRRAGRDHDQRRGRRVEATSRRGERAVPETT